MKKCFLYPRLLYCSSAICTAQINYAKQMAATIMNQYKDSMVVKKYASHLEQDKLPEGNRPANWNYEIGVVLMGFERFG